MLYYNDIVDCDGGESLYVQGSLQQVKHACLILLAWAVVSGSSDEIFSIDSSVQ